MAHEIGHSPDKAGRSGAGRRLVGGRSGAGRAPVGGRSGAGRRSVGGRSGAGRRSVGRRSVGGRSDSFSTRTFCIESSRFRARVAKGRPAFRDHITRGSIESIIVL